MVLLNQVHARLPLTLTKVIVVATRSLTLASQSTVVASVGNRCHRRPCSTCMTSVRSAWQSLQVWNLYQVLYGRALLSAELGGLLRCEVGPEKSQP